MEDRSSRRLCWQLHHHFCLRLTSTRQRGLVPAPFNHSHRECPTIRGHAAGLYTYLLACSSRTRKNSYTTLSPCCCVKNPRACSSNATLVPSILFFVVLPLDTTTPVGSLSSWPGPDAEASRPRAMNRIGPVLLERTSNAQTLSSVFSWSCSVSPRSSATSICCSLAKLILSNELCT